MEYTGYILHPSIPLKSKDSTEIKHKRFTIKYTEFEFEQDGGCFYIQVTKVYHTWSWPIWQTGVGQDKYSLYLIGMWAEQTRAEL